MDQFLATPELLELMFLQSEMGMVLVDYPLVCRQWNDIIQRSPAVQVHLFRRPDLRQQGSGSTRLNPVLSTLFRPFFVSNTNPGSGGFFGREHFEQLALARNPEAFMRRGASVSHLYERPNVAGRMRRRTATTPGVPSAQESQVIHSTDGVSRSGEPCTSSSPRYECWASLHRRRISQPCAARS